MRGTNDSILTDRLNNRIVSQIKILQIPPLSKMISQVNPKSHQPPPKKIFATFLNISLQSLTIILSYLY